MGHLEQRGKRRKQKRDLTYAILSTIKASALIGVFLMAPNLPSALVKTGIIPSSPSDASAVGRARRRLIDQGLLTKKENRFRLTARGEAALSLLQARYEDTTSKAKRKQWDGRWRVLIFDVPEYRKSVRDKIRRTLIGVGFVRLQDSVWVYPYDCEDLIMLLKADFRIGRDVLYMIVDELEGDHRLRKEFGLK